MLFTLCALSLNLPLLGGTVIVFHQEVFHERENYCTELKLRRKIKNIYIYIDRVYDNVTSCFVPKNAFNSDFFAHFTANCHDILIHIIKFRYLFILTDTLSNSCNQGKPSYEL